ncbi:MAG: class I SAM-dependent methyltransferase, partial [Promethearchaeota archaeon]
MHEFEKSNWNKAEYSNKYLDNADIYIQERENLLNIVASFYRKFIKDTKKKRVLDLGCGNGILSKTLYMQKGGMEIVVIDGSKDMLTAAKKELEGMPISEFCQISFEEIIQGKFKRGLFDFIVSSFAIHHIELPQKKKLFKRIFEMMYSNAYFLNIDVVLSNYKDYNEWYYDLWKEWIICRQKLLNLNNSFEQIPEEARNKPENHYDLLNAQLDSLKSIGFS